MSPLFSSGRSGTTNPYPAGVCLQPADVQVHLFGQPEALPAELNQSPEATSDLRCRLNPLVARDLEDLQEFPHCGGVVHALAHERENLIARGHWNLV